MKKPADDAKAAGVPPARTGGDDPFGLAPWLKQMPGMPLHPLMANPMTAMAATTAIGFGIAGQMASAMLGMMQSATERTKAALDEAAEATSEKAKPVLTVVPKPPEPAEKAEPPVVERGEPAARETAAEPKPARKAPAKVAKADDLKAISGIGPKLEQVLNGMGLRRYADIVALKPADVARIEAELGLDGRIARDGWVEQAKRLAKGRG